MKVLVLLLMANISYGCNNKPLDIKDVADQIEKQIEKQNTEQKQQEVFNLLSKGISVKELQDISNKLSKDADEEQVYINLTKEQLALKAQGIECVTCDLNAEDPNMRSN